MAPTRGARVSSTLSEAEELARRAHGVVSGAVNRWTDPRERALRRIRAARATGVGLGAGAATLGMTTGAMVVSEAPELLVASGAGLTALVAVPAVAAVLRLRSLRRRPLPAGRAVAAPLPARGAAARRPMEDLRTCEASLHELLGLLADDPSVPPAEVDQARTAAHAAAIALRTEAAELGALERARDSSAAAVGELTPVISARVERLEGGVRDYGALVAATGRAVAAASGGVARDAAAATEALDRMDALSAALTELAGSRAPR